MKKIAALSLFFLLVATFQSRTFAQGVSCPAVVASPDTVVCGTPCFNVTATPVGGYETTTYTVGQIPYVPYPFTTGTQVLVAMDDIYSPVITLPFDFCFYGGTYNQLIVGSNGCISFNVANANGFDAWAINAAIPGNNAVANSICAPWHDMDPRFGGTIRWNVYGTAPCRVFVVSWNQIPMFSCNNLIATQQIAIYETTNIVETFIANKPSCTTWQGAAAIHGIQNAAATAATVVPGRNFPTQWAATNDAWAFTPAGAPNFSVTWFESGNATPIGNTNTVQVCPSGNTDYIAVAEYINCNGDTVSVQDTASVIISGANFGVTITKTDITCFGDSNGTATAMPQGGAGPFTYQWSPYGGMNATATNLGPGTFTVVVTDSTGCAISQTVDIIEPPQLTTSGATTDVLCNGGSTGSATVTANGGTPGYTYAWSPFGGTNATATGLTAGPYSVIVSDSNNCMDTLNVMINEPPAITISTSSIPVACNGGSNGIAIASASGGTGTLTYLWLPANIANDTATGLSPGTYTVVV
ncbi:MAG: SprB repeat-containing protein, partial [Bacteroidota bacterium]